MARTARSASTPDPLPEVTLSSFDLASLVGLTHEFLKVAVSGAIREGIIEDVNVASLQGHSGGRVKVYGLTYDQSIALVEGMFPDHLDELLLIWDWRHSQFDVLQGYE